MVATANGSVATPPIAKESPNCAKCNDSGISRQVGETYCQCKLGRRLAEQGMVAGEHGL